MTKSTLLSATDFSRQVDGRMLLDDVSLELCRGDRIGLVGPTGSGKSLMLRSLAMLEPIDSGKLRWRQSAISSDQATAFRSQVIYLHQRAARFEGTVETVLRLPFQMRIHRQRSFHRQWIIDQLSAVGRDATFLDQPHDQLSGGETQIIALLRAIQLAPAVLLLDEPTSALDAETTRHVESIVMRWHEESADSRAMIWVSHDPKQAERVCDSVIYMREGQIDVVLH